MVHVLTTVFAFQAPSLPICSGCLLAQAYPGLGPMARLKRGVALLLWSQGQDLVSAVLFFKICSFLSPGVTLR